MHAVYVILTTAKYVWPKIEPKYTAEESVFSDTFF